MKFAPFWHARRACAILVPALLAAVSACASQGGDSTGVQGPITVAVQIAAPTSAPVYLADSLGYFKQQGIDVNIEISSDDYLSVAAGQIPYGLVGTSQLVEADENGIGLQEICVTQVDPAYILAVSQTTLTSRGITPAMSLKQTLTRLKGERATEVGGPDTPGGVLLADLLKRNGLPADWITVVSQTSSATAAASFDNGQVGVIFQPQPVPDQLLSKVPGRIIYNTRGSALFADLAQVAWTGLVGTKSYIAAHSNLNKKICAAIGKANEYLTANPVQAAKVLEPKMTSFSLNFLQDGLTSYRWAADGTMSQARFQASISDLASYGMIQPPSASVLKAAYTSVYQS
jgi:ABC-type nitrate/sulfonate/bicarbonate transport system substrate-binding protein